MKNILKSRTVWLAVAQAVGSVAIVILTEMDMMGAVLVVKSLVDILLRIDTKEPVL